MGTWLKRRVEEASLSAWPATHQVLIDGWVARISSGYTKRANSVVPLYPSMGRDLSARVVTCEKLYNRFGLPAIFRLLSFSEPESLDRLLEQRGYGYLDGTCVMTRHLTELPEAGSAGTYCDRMDLDRWLVEYARISGADADTNTLHREILSRIPAETGYFTLRRSEDGAALSCGLAVADGLLAGLFDIVTAPAHRQRGHATRLVWQMARWSRQQGAGTAYLQVVETNRPAIRLYERLGFTELYRYWYRVPPAHGSMGDGSRVQSTVQEH